MKHSIWTERFSGQVAVVTGGADGLGLAIAQRLLAEGATVWLLDRNEQRVTSVARDAGAEARAAAVDICDEAEVQTVFERIYSQHGRVDVVVNSAGIVGPNNCKVTDTPTDGF